MKKIYLPMDETVEFIFHNPSTGRRVHAIGNFTDVDLKQDWYDESSYSNPFALESWNLKLEAAIRRINVFRG